MRLIAGLCALAVAFGPTGPSADMARASSGLPWSAPATPKVVTDKRRFSSGDAELSADQKVSLDPKHAGTEHPDSAEYLAILASWLALNGFTAR